MGFELPFSVERQDAECKQPCHAAFSYALCPGTGASNDEDESLFSLPLKEPALGGEQP